MAGLEAGTTHIPPSSSSGAAVATSSTASCASGDNGEGGKGKRPKLPSFWIPTLTPSAKPTEIKKPVRFFYILYIYIVHVHTIVCMAFSLKMHVILSLDHSCPSLLPLSLAHTHTHTASSVSILCLIHLQDMKTYCPMSGKPLRVKVHVHVYTCV